MAPVPYRAAHPGFGAIHGNQAVLRMIHQVVRSPGKPLDPATRGLFEPRFDRDFRRVRVHADARAAESAHAVHAAAYTVGQHIVFDSGKYQPADGNGQRLIAHELTHTIQQGATDAGPQAELEISSPTDQSEHEADAAGHAVVTDRFVDVAASSPVHVARAPEGEEEPGIVDRAKAAIYKKLISSLRGPQQEAISSLRKIARTLPEGTEDRVRLEHIADDYEFISDLLISLVEGIVALLVGIVSGLIALVEGLVRIALGLSEGLGLLLSGIAHGDLGPVKRWAINVGKAIAGIPAALAALVTAWLAKFKTATTDEQSIMIGELTGQIIALLIPLALTGGAAGGAAVGEAGETAEVVGGVSRVTSTGVRLTSVPVSADVSSQAAATAARASSPLASFPVEGSAALKPIPLDIPVPVEPLPAVAPAVTPVAAAGTSEQTTTKGAIVAALRTAAATKESPKDKKKRCSNEPCPTPLPIMWPVSFLPEPLYSRPWIRQSKGDRVWEGTERGPAQRQFHDKIEANRRDLIPPPNPCFVGDSEPNAPYDAHHIQPLFLGGEDAPYNLCGLSAGRHQLGHPALDNQTDLLDVYEACGICSGFLTKHPPEQTYYIAGEKS